MVDKANSEDPSARYWAVTWLGVNKVKSAKDKVTALTQDSNPTVRIAANLALFKIDPDYDPIPALNSGLDDVNLIVGMYAINAIEQTGLWNEAVKKAAEKAANSKYEFTRRFGNYLVEKVGETN